jgi:hypothetical protein
VSEVSLGVAATQDWGPDLTLVDSYIAGVSAGDIGALLRDDPRTAFVPVVVSASGRPPSCDWPPSAG